MKRMKLCIVLLIMTISSLFFVSEIYGVFKKITSPVTNNLTIFQKTSYTVVHETMNLDGTTYSEYSHIDYTNATIGDVVSPEVLIIEGFESPSVQNVILESYDNTVITYKYPRKQYILTINGDNYVTTSTPSGTYYYNQEIHLVADATDSSGNAFVKWSNGVLNPDYTFVMKDDVTIEPIYADAYTITYEPNNGEEPIIDYIVQKESLNNLPEVSYDDCVSETGNYHDRQCSNVYKFEGWYTEPSFTNRVNADYVPTGDTTLYAKWNKIYYANNESFICDGNNYIDTGVSMFNQLNADKDFIVKFRVDENNGYNTSSGDRGTIFTDMNESGEPFPGVQFFSTSNTNYTMNINITGHKVKNSNTGYVTGQSVVIKKIDGIVYYNYNNGTDVQINDFSNFNTYFNNPATFCSGINAQGNKYRFFKGTISDMSVELIDPKSYTLHFDANGGTGMMLDQIVKLGENTVISSNEFFNGNYSFNEWNTKPDGSGTSFPNNYNITSDLGNADDYIILYAQWIPAAHYYVHFDANGGTGTMDDQILGISFEATPLTTNEFTKTGYEFIGWNTEPDGTGTHYDNEQSVRDLSNINDDVVTLYAEWIKIQYSHPGDAVFDGTSSTFIDTGINLFSSENIDKDFEIRFTFKSVDSDVFSFTPTQPTLFNAKDETNNKYPGLNIRFNGKIDTFYATYRWGGNTVNVPSSGISTRNAPINFIYKRSNGIITMQYSYDGFTSQVYTLFNQNSWTLNQEFATNVAFGGYFDGNNQPGRFFKGVLSDMIILMND